MKELFKYIYICILICVPAFLFAQGKTPADGDTLKVEKKDSVRVIYIYKDREPEAKPKEKKEKKEKTQTEEPKEIELRGNLYKVRSAWMNLGLGTGLYTKTFDSKPALGIGLNTPINDLYGKLTVNASLIDRSRYRNNYVAMGLGKRYQTTGYNISWYGGLSYLLGHVRLTDSLQNVYYARIGAIGLYAEASYFYKVFYDIGVGATAFAIYNKQAPMVGIRLELYFSNAFKKKLPPKN